MKPKSIVLDNTVLKAAVAQIEKNIQPHLKPAYDKIVVAGMKVGLNGGKDSPLAKLITMENPAAEAGKGAASLVLILRKNSKDSMPQNVMVTAGGTLTLYALEFLEDSKTITVGKEEITAAMKAYTNTIFKALGITPQMLIKGNETMEKITKDPAAMELMRRKAGLVKAPGTSSPVDNVPVEEEEIVETEDGV